MSQIKGIYQLRIQTYMNDPEKENCKEEDYNHLIHIIIIHKIIKIIRLGIMLTFISFYVGISCAIIFQLVGAILDYDTNHL